MTKAELKQHALMNVFKILGVSLLILSYITSENTTTQPVSRYGAIRYLKEFLDALEMLIYFQGLLIIKKL